MESAAQVRPDKWNEFVCSSGVGGMCTCNARSNHCGALRAQPRRERNSLLDAVVQVKALLRARRNRNRSIIDRIPISILENSSLDQTDIRSRHSSSAFYVSFNARCFAGLLEKCRGFDRMFNRSRSPKSKARAKFQ